MTPDTPAPGPTIGDVAVGLRRLWLPVLVFVAVLTASGYALGSTAEETHEARASLLVAEPRDQVGVFGDQIPGPAIDVESIELLARSDAVRLRVADRLGLPLERVDDVDVDVADETRIVVLRAVGRTPTEAIDLATAHADAVVEERAARLADELDTIVQVLASRVAEREAALASLRSESAAAPDQPELEARVDAAAAATEVLRERQVQLEVEAEVAAPGVVVADRPADAQPVGGPDPIELAVLGGLVGLILAAGVVYLRLSYALAAEEGRSRVQPRLRRLDSDVSTSGEAS